jgi:serine protease Do
VVSGLSRSIVASDRQGGVESLEELIQTDAAINGGNSGGPLLDLNGNVIGVNVAIVSGAQNVGFALSSNSVKNVVESVRETGKISRPYLGVRYIPITEELSESNNLKFDYGVLVQRGETPEDLAIIPGSPADKSGILENDIILEIDGKKLDAGNSLSTVIAGKKAGDEISLKIYSKGKEKIVTVRLEEFDI